jgi:archaemetzincin
MSIFRYHRRVMRSRLPILSLGATIAVACALAADRGVDAAPEQAGAGTRPPAEAGPLPTTATPDKAPPVPRVLYLQPLGEQLGPEAVSLVETALREFYAFEVRQLPVRPLPPSAYYAPRKRYRAEKLLVFIEPLVPADAHRVLGLTAADISTTKWRILDWGIMGLATIDGRVSVMSMFRCRRGSRSEQHARERLGKVAVHEVGHTLGLEHCPTRGCLMEDARGTNTTTDREHVLCPTCRRLLEARGYVLPPSPSPPWPRPRTS